MTEGISRRRLLQASAGVGAAGLLTALQETPAAAEILSDDAAGPSHARAHLIQQIIVDNEDPGFTRKGFPTLSRTGNRDHYADDYLHSGNPAVLGQQWARWTPTIDSAGNYKIFVRWNSFSNRPSAVPLTVTSQGGAKRWTTTIDQRANSLSWYYLGDFELAAGTGNYVEITDENGPYTIADAVKFVGRPPTRGPDYVDDFSDERIGRSPSHWIESHESDDWRTLRDGTNTVYSHFQRTGQSPTSWLNVFEQDVDVTASVKVTGHPRPGATVGLPVRYNTEESQVYAGYDFDSRTWQIKERRGADFDWSLLATSAAEDLTPHTWHTLRVTAWAGAVALYVDDSQSPKISTGQAEHRSPGRVALNSAGTMAAFDNVKVTLLSGQGRVTDGVLDYTLNKDDGVYREGASVIALTNGDIMIRVEDDLFRSTDNGRTFTAVDNTWPSNPFTHNSFLRLRSGALLTMVSEVAQPPINDDPPNRFRAMTSMDDGQSWQSGGLTWNDFREGMPDRAAAIVMNDKLSQASTGRIFYTVTIRRFVDGAIHGHNVEVYYSDDDGDTWAKSPGNSDDWGSAQAEFGEGKVIEAADGSMQLYAPYTDTATILRSVSTDGGTTWAGIDGVPGLDNARSSFGVTKSPGEEPPVYFMVWVFNDYKEIEPSGILPRSRLALATSQDGINWKYVMDLDRWVSPRGAKHQSITQFVDPGITVTDDYVYVTAGRSERSDEAAHNFLQLRVYRVERAKIDTYEAWPVEF